MNLAKRRIIKSGVILLLILLLISLCFASIFAKANSAPARWGGSTASGVTSSTKNCPIEVTSEKLTFNINDFPKGYYENKEDFEKYSSNVVAEYNFYNPTDYKINATLLFPFGNKPEYMVNTFADEYYTDAYKRSIFVNNELVENRMRVLHIPYDEDFNSNTVYELENDYTEVNFYTPTKEVTKYRFRFSSNADSFKASFEINEYLNRYKTRAFGDFCTSNNVTRLETYYHESEFCLDLYLVGQSFENLPAWKFENIDGEVSGSVELIETEKMTFLEAINLFKKDNEITDIDWYNAVTSHFGERFLGYIDNIELKLMRFCEYDIEIEPKSSITNTVEVPIYPDIESDYNPNKFDYKYLVSPAKNWANFKDLEIRINTTSHLLSSSLEGFEKVDGGYNLKLENLPETELYFTLCEVENPKYTRGFAVDLTFIIIMLAIFVFPIVLGLTLAIIFVIVKNKKKKKDNINQEEIKVNEEEKPSKTEEKETEETEKENIDSNNENTF